MVREGKPKVYVRPSDVFRLHGPLVWFLYWAVRGLSCLTVSHIVRYLPYKLSLLRFVRDTRTTKVKAWWQDIASAVPLLMTVLVVRAASGLSVPASRCLQLAAAYLVFDLTIYHVRVLWFDDIAPGIGDSRRAVWSHRRILFLAIIAFVQSIFLFPAIYWLDPNLRGADYQSLLERSFTTATFTSIARELTAIDVVQVAISLFFLAMVIATTASIAYRRGEVAGELQEK